MSTADKNRPVPAAAWEPYFRAAKVRSAELDGCRSERAKAISIGKFMAQLVGRVVPIQVHGRTGTAELRMTDGRAREKRYHLVVRWDPELPETEAVIRKQRNAGSTLPSSAADRPRDRDAVPNTPSSENAGVQQAPGGRRPPKTTPAARRAPTPARPKTNGNTEDW